MLVRCHHDPREFFELVGPFLLRNEVENSQPLGIARSFVDTATHDGLMFSVESGADVVAVAVKSPHRNLVVTRAPEPAMRALANYLFAYALPVPGIVAPLDTAHDFSRAWKALTDLDCTQRIALRLFQATRVNEVAPAKGYFRYAQRNDQELIESWLHAFIDECNLDRFESIRDRVMQMINLSNVGLWECEENTSMAAITRRSDRGAHLSWVYTPKPHRGKGYATACVAELCKRELEHGKQYCTLFTDLANPTSNAIYQRVGFEPVCDSVDLVFKAA
jgi:predicted GNAT family acetyltransferase